MTENRTEDDLALDMDPAPDTDSLQIHDQIRALGRNESLTLDEKTRAIQDLYNRRSSVSRAAATTKEQGGGPCEHYVRYCDIQSVCCGKWYSCRICHDENQDHKIDRRATKRIRCRECGTEQGVSNECISCSMVFGEKAFCGVCRLWSDKESYHCDGCGLCRIGKREHYVHCDACCSCQLAKGHECINMSTKEKVCPVCLESIFDAPGRTWERTKCGHALHSDCYRNLLRTDNYQCPTCQKSMVPMNWEGLADLIEAQPMPAEARKTVQITCRDCNSVSKDVAFHYLGTRCANLSCGSFNTMID